MLPKIIHYCWFGRKPMSDLAVKCIESWQKFCPDYEIKEWNEDNYDVHKIQYISQAYEAKKYAFVSDYARFDILYHYGGIYFDTDVEIIKDLSPIIEQGAFMGLESPGLINSGLGLGSPVKTEIVKEILDSYEKDTFIYRDGSINNKKTVVHRVSEIFAQYGFTEEETIQEIKGYNIYPIEYFCPKNYQTGITNITPNTYTIHHYDGSWLSNAQKRNTVFRHKMIARFGDNIFSKIICKMYELFYKIREDGVAKVWKYYWKKHFA